MTSSIQLHFSGWCHSIHGISCCSHRCAMGRSRLPPTHPSLVKNFRFFGCFSLNKNSHLSIIYPLSNPRLHTYGCSISKAKPLFVVILFLKVNAFESRQKYPITKRWKILNLRRRPLKSSYRSSFIYVNSLLIFEVEFEVIYLDFFHNIWSWRRSLVGV